MKLPSGITIGNKQIVIKRGSYAYGHLLGVYSGYFNSIILDKDLMASVKRTTDKSKNLVSVFSLVDGLVMTRDFLLANGVMIGDEKLKILTDTIISLQQRCPKAFKTIKYHMADRCAKLTSKSDDDKITQAFKKRK